MMKFTCTHFADALNMKPHEGKTSTNMATHAWEDLISSIVFSVEAIISLCALSSSVTARNLNGSLTSSLENSVCMAGNRPLGFTTLMRCFVKLLKRPATAPARFKDFEADLSSVRWVFFLGGPSDRWTQTCGVDDTFRVGAGESKSQAEGGVAVFPIRRSLQTQTHPAAL